MAEHPAFRERADDIGVAFARAFRLAYDAARWTEALEIAGLDLATLPGRASAEDRLLTAAAKRVDELSGALRLEEAEALLDDVEKKHPELAARLDLAVCPAAVVAAVKERDFDRADRLAARFEAASFGAPAGFSLSAWVRSLRPAPAAPGPPRASGSR